MNSSYIKAKQENPNSLNCVKSIDDSHISTIEVKQTKTEIGNNNNKTENFATLNQETSQYIEEMRKGQYNILVTVRCRPLNSKEKEINSKEIMKIIDRKVIVLQDPNNSNTNNTRSREQTMAFDFAFDKNETQEQIFNSTTKFLIDGVVNGYNATVFAYGATGAGKTYTMLGNDDNPGIMPLTIKELFSKIQSLTEREYTVKLWYLEIYNENIKDLMTNSDECLDLREDPNKGVVVSGITELTATSSEHILNILKKGNKNRTTEATNANETSSRSHAILQILVSYKDKNCGINYEIKYGKLSLIDLAGSERASATLNRGIRLIEGANINRSLLTLGNCINALCEANEKGTKPYIPYRDSKLTRLLKDSLGGNSRTVMIANVSPFAGTFDDTYNTLKYANRAKNIKTNVQRNVLNAQHHITNYVNLIKNLQNRINELETQAGKRRENTTSPQKLRRDNQNDSLLDENNSIFSKIVSELKILCEQTLQLKQKIINEQNEIFMLINQIKKDVQTQEEEKKKLTVKNMKKVWEKKLSKFKEYSQKIDTYIDSKMSHVNLSFFQKDYINYIIRHHKSRVANLDLKFKLFHLGSQSEKKDSFISLLESQIEIRDEIISFHNIKIEDLVQEMKQKYKSWEQIKKESFSHLFISNNTSSANSRTSNTHDLSMQLPPLSTANHNNATINSVLSELREMNHNLNQQFKNIQQKQNINKLSPKEQKIFVRDFSNGIRNINSANTNATTILNKKTVPKNFLCNNSNLNSIYQVIPSSAKPQRMRARNPNQAKSGSQRDLTNHNFNENTGIQGILSNQNSVIDENEQSIWTAGNIYKNERPNHFKLDRKNFDKKEGRTLSSFQQGGNDISFKQRDQSYPSIYTEQSKYNKNDKQNYGNGINKRSKIPINYK